jgi:peroxiredoxin
MNRFIVFVACTLLSACASSQSDPQNQTRATTPPPAQHTEAVANYDVINSRNPEDIKHEFPYDIDLKKADGTVINSSKAFKQDDKPTLLLFWLTTCVPCRYELEAIKEKYQQWQAQVDFNMYAVSTDFPKNFDRFVLRATESGWGWETYHDMNREFMMVMPGELNGLPQTFILDKNGKIVYHKRKFVPGEEEEIFAKLKELGAKK